MNVRMPSDPETRQRLSDARRNVLRATRLEHRRRRTLTLTIGGVVALAAASSIAATVVLWTAGPDEARTTVVCYQHDDLNSVSASYGGQLVPTPGLRTGTPTVDPQAMCALAWKSGIAQVDGPHGRWPNINPNTSTIRVPPLAFCIRNDGITAGFPIERPATTAPQVCSQLGLRQWHS